MAEMEIHRNDRVMTADGMEVGEVKHVIVDGTTRQVTEIVVDQDGHEMLVPLGAVLQSGNNRLTLRSTADELASTAAFDRHQYHALDEDALYEESGGRAVPGSATLEHASGDTAVIADERGTNAMPAAGSAQPNRQRNDERLSRREAGKEYGRDDANIRVPVVEEQLKAGVREKQGGTARIVKDVVEERKTIDVPVEREEVYVTERAVNRRPATEAELNARDRDIAVPLREQEVVTQKEARVVGEVDVRKETVTDTERVSDTVRREEVHVEDAGNARVHVEGERGTRGQAETGGKTVTDKRQYDAQGNLIAETERVDDGPKRSR